MSLPATFGVAHVYGLYDTVAFVTLQSDDIGIKPALDVEVTDETGRVITDRLDDQRKEITLNGVLKPDVDIPSVGQTITYFSVVYIIKDVTTSGVNNNFRKVSLKGVKYQEIA